MSVIAINASPRKNGNTEAALNKIAEVLQTEEITTEIIQIGNKTIGGCRACGGCYKTGRCVFDDGVNEIAEQLAAADGILIGSPVYYAGINGTLKSFLDRVFVLKSAAFRFKPCAAVVVARRAGTTAALQNINSFFQFAEMLITPTVYWSGIHGREAGQAVQDAEGMQMFSQLAKNMAYLIKLRSANAVEVQEKEERVMFNFIR